MYIEKQFYQFGSILPIIGRIANFLFLSCLPTVAVAVSPYPHIFDVTRLETEKTFSLGHVLDSLFDSVQNFLYVPGLAQPPEQKQNSQQPGQPSTAAPKATKSRPSGAKRGQAEETHSRQNYYVGTVFLVRVAERFLESHIVKKKKKSPYIWLGVQCYGIYKIIQKKKKLRNMRKKKLKTK